MTVRKPLPAQTTVYLTQLGVAGPAARSANRLVSRLPAPLQAVFRRIEPILARRIPIRLGWLLILCLLFFAGGIAMGQTTLDQEPLPRGHALERLHSIPVPSSGGHSMPEMGLPLVEIDPWSRSDGGPGMDWSPSIPPESNHLLSSPQPSSRPSLPGQLTFSTEWIMAISALVLAIWFLRDAVDLSTLKFPAMLPLSLQRRRHSPSSLHHERTAPTLRDDLAFPGLASKGSLFPSGENLPDPGLILQIASSVWAGRNGLDFQVLEDPMTFGLETRTGNTRSRNEDAALGLAFDGGKAILIADGVGGHPDGDRASRVAVLAAAGEILFHPGSPSTLPRRAMEAAAQALQRQGRAIGKDSPRDGLRTTLIIVVATDQDYHYAYIGDGGCVIWREDRPPELLLQPQKGDYDNTLSASLGPRTLGHPSYGTSVRQPGDWLVAGTDGVFDVFATPEEFTQRLRLCYENERLPDIESLVRSTVEQIEGGRDEAGYFTTDNLTLSVLTTPVIHPRRSPQATTPSSLEP